MAEAVLREALQPEVFADSPEGLFSRSRRGGACRPEGRLDRPAARSHLRRWASSLGLKKQPALQGLRERLLGAPLVGPDPACRSRPRIPAFQSTGPAGSKSRSVRRLLAFPAGRRRRARRAGFWPAPDLLCQACDGAPGELGRDTGTRTGRVLGILHCACGRVHPGELLRCKGGCGFDDIDVRGLDPHQDGTALDRDSRSRADAASLDWKLFRNVNHCRAAL